MSFESRLELNIIKDQIRHHCAFTGGMERIDALIPSYDPLIIQRENRRAVEALKIVVKYGPMPFSGIRDISELLDNAKKGRTLTGSELCQVIGVIRGIKGILNFEKSIEEIEHEEIHDLCCSLIYHGNCEKIISCCINDYGEVVDDASSELRGIRRQLRSIDGEIAAAAQKFIMMHSASVVDNIITYRNGRAVILVKASDKNMFNGLLYGDSASGQASYVEPAGLMAVNNRKQELVAREQEEVNKILIACSKEVKAIAASEIANLETCAVLDEIFSKACWGKEVDGVVAELTENKYLSIKKARHPLIDPEQVVANDYHLIDPVHMLLITGPNTGGKTVSMKVIGLFTLMTYCGIPVPCDHAVIPYFDQVFADIGDDQSVVSSLSNFSAHVKKQADVCRNATGRSLVLLDEIGSGTDPKEGESLAIAILNELRQRETMTVATTHYSRLKAYGKRHDDILVASVQFDMDALQPTYKYLEGISGQSNALEVAQRYGLPKGIIKYARSLKEQAKTSEDELIDRLEKQLNDTRKKNEELDRKLTEIKEFQKSLMEDKVRFEKEKDEWHRNLEMEHERYTEEAKQEADEILKRMRKMQETSKYHEVLAERQKLIRQQIPEIASEFPEKSNGFCVGDTVEIKSSGQAALITNIRRKDIEISLNGRIMKVKAEQLRPSLKVIPKKKAVPIMFVSGMDMFANVPMECNLIGMRVEEAMEEMSSYMDSAKLKGLKEFRIIHGDGSGALRKAVHAALGRNNEVDSFRLGMPAEGGTGATIVKMKE